MRSLAIAFVVLVVAAYSNMALGVSLRNDGHLRGPAEQSTPIEKRETAVEESSQEEFNSFIEEKLMHQSQALEHLITAVDKSGDMIKKLIENLSQGIEKPKLPARAQAASPEVHNAKQRSEHNQNNSTPKDHPIVKLGKNIPKLGKLAKDLIMKEVQTGTDPTPLIEQETNRTLGSRRSFGGDEVLIPSQQSGDNKVNPWCPMALLCQKAVDPVCGYDDQFGYGKFENLCHMLRVNCYWKYNFAMVYSCSPKL